MAKTERPHDFEREHAALLHLIDLHTPPALLQAIETALVAILDEPHAIPTVVTTEGTEHADAR